MALTLFAIGTAVRHRYNLTVGTIVGKCPDKRGEARFVVEWEDGSETRVKDSRLCWAKPMQYGSQLVAR